jgi:uncharacterized protein (TIGR01777 family)
MRILLTGSSGLLGAMLRRHWEAEGREVVRLVRRRPAGRGEHEWRPTRGVLEPVALEGVDVVVHLAGAGIASGRWTERRKKEILESRVRGTRLLADTMASGSAKPATFVCASAVGYYGNQGDCELDESCGPGSGFLPEVARQWEGACAAAREAGIRTVHGRFGVVLSPDGGVLARLKLPFSLGVGGPWGSGGQYLSWMSARDFVRAVDRCIDDECLDGPVNITSPNPVTVRVFAKALGRALHRPALLPAPSVAIRLLFGQMGEESLLASTRAVPARLLAGGFTFVYPDVAGALEHALAKRRQ